MPPGYLKNADIARRYNVSTATVSRWFRLAQENKNALQIEELDNRLLAINSYNNHAEFKRLAEIGKKYKIDKDKVYTEPHADFYKLFTVSEQIEIIESLENNTEIPYKYRFAGDGANNYIGMLSNIAKNITGAYNGSFFSFLNTHINSNLTSLVSTKKVQIVDMCVGDGSPVKPTIEYLIEQNREIVQYHALDYSERMLELNKKSLERWFPTLPYVSTRIDLLRNELRPHVDPISYNNADCTTIYFNVGDAFNNFDDPEGYLCNVTSTMNKGDLFVLSSNRDVHQIAKHITDHQTGYRKYKVFVDYTHDKYLFDLVGVDTSDFIGIMKLEDHKYTRGFKFNQDHQITFDLPQGKKEVTIPKDTVVDHLHLESYPLPALTQWFAENNLQILRYVSGGEYYGLFILTKS